MRIIQKLILFRGFIPCIQFFKISLLVVQLWFVLYVSHENLQSINMYYQCFVIVISYIYVIYYFNWFYILNSLFKNFKFNYVTSIALFFMDKILFNYFKVEAIIFTICWFIHLSCTLFFWPFMLYIFLYNLCFTLICVPYAVYSVTIFNFH